MKAAYLRVSTDEQKKGETIKGQLLAIKKFTNGNIKFYKDEGWSGALLQRPALDELRKDIETGEIKKLYIYHPDRLSRKQSYQFLLLDEFEKAQVQVTFTSLPDFFEGSQESQVVNKSVWSMVSELERLRISERFRLGKLRKVGEGKIITSKPPYGFRLKKKYKFLHEPHEIAVVKKILNWALEGKSGNEIIKLLYKRRIKTRNGNEVWAKSTIFKILNTNLYAYAGTWYYNKFKHIKPKNPTSKRKYKHSEKSSRTLNDKSEWIPVKIPEVAIITQDQADKIRKIKRKNKVVKKGNIKNNYLLQGKIYCTSCKGLNYCDNFHGTPYYRCADRRRSFPHPSKCPGGSIKSEALESVVWDKLTDLLTNPDLIEKKAREFVDKNIKDSVAEPEIAELVRRKAELEKQKEKLAEGYTKGLIGNVNMKKQTKRIKQEEAILLEDERELKHRNNKVNEIDMDSLTENIDKLSEEARCVLLESNFNKKREILTWLDVKVNYFRYNYNIQGSIAIPTKLGSKLPLIN
jgi:site-specific DNA recombinase